MENLRDLARAPLNPDASVGQVRGVQRVRKASVLILRFFAALSVFTVAWALFDSRFFPLVFLDVRAFTLAAILLGAGIIDLAKGVVPIEITYPLMLAGIMRAIVVGDPMFLLYWFALAMIYLLNVVGGGDVKLLMGMFGLFPHLEFFIVMEVVILVTHLPIVLLRRLRQKNLRVQIQTVRQWVHINFIEFMLGETAPQTLVRQAIVKRPTIETLSQRGDRLAIAFSVAGILYLFLCTPAGLNWHIQI